MRRSVLLCFHPFSFAGRNPSTLSPLPDAIAFYSFLLEDLTRLEQSLAEGPVSLRWSVEAMNLLKRMQGELLSLFKKANLPITFGAEEDWFDQYMKQTATLLDFCNSLKSALSRIYRYLMVIDIGLRRINTDNSSACMVSLSNIEFKSLEKEQQKFSSVKIPIETVEVGGGRIGFESSKTNDKCILTDVMVVAKSTMIVVSLLLISAVVSPLSIDIGIEELSSKFPQLKPFVDKLTALVVRFQERVPRRPENGFGLVLAEHEMVEMAVGELKGQLVDGERERERLLSSVEKLRTSSVGLREGVEMFDAVVGEVFEVAIRGRNEMLGIFRDGALSQS